MKHGLILAAGILALGWSPAVAAAGESGDSVMVVFNKRLSASKEVAAHYAKVRKVPDSQVIGFDLTTNEVVTRTEFENRLQRPLFDYMVARGIFQFPPQGQIAEGSKPGMTGSLVRYLVLCHGLPLKIPRDDTIQEQEPTGLPANLRHNEAAVDSELTWLPSLRKPLPLRGPLPNPFYTITNLHLMHPTNGFIITARLDGPTPEVAGALVDKALEAEEFGLWGRAYFDARGLTDGTYQIGDDRIQLAASMLRSLGFETVLDTKPGTFSDTFPMSQIAFYAGWYDESASGPFTRREVEFRPGAFAYHLHSYSAATLRSTQSHWAGPLLAKGVTATVGYVYEPYLLFTSDLPVFFRNFIFGGASFGEAAWAAERAISWQTTVVGDPLYRPFMQPFEVLHHQLEARFSRLVEWSHLMVVNRNLLANTPPADLIHYLGQVPLTRHSAVLSEKLADLYQLQKDSAKAESALEQALQGQPSGRQKERLLQALAQLQASAGRNRESLQTWQRFLAEVRDYPKPLEVYQKMLPLARKIGDKLLTSQCEAEIQRLTPPPPTTNSPPK